MTLLLGVLIAPAQFTPAATDTLLACDPEDGGESALACQIAYLTNRERRAFSVLRC
ncbi:MAG: hypothetical protein P9L99_00215 [Candidatus Lernaella stagnicola]|nr:hypothetical protein [Candidatus Lernaella stagnicola]